MQLRTMPKTTRTSYEGVIDADGHINEPHDLWEKYLEPQFRDRASALGATLMGVSDYKLPGNPHGISLPTFSRVGGVWDCRLKSGSNLTRTPYKDSAPFGAMIRKSGCNCSISRG